MSQKQINDMAASVRQRLLNRSHERGEDFQLTLIYYGLERLIYRLSRSPHRDRFVLKGAMLFSVWSETPHRATRDLDLLGHGDHDVATLITTFKEICRTSVEDDGVVFFGDAMTGEEIREGEEYAGVRLSFEAQLGVAKIPIQVDIGFGDAVVPEPEPLDYPTLLDFPTPRLLAYSRETVVAEKFQSMVELGIANSRMKDFFDLWRLSRMFSFEGARLVDAIQATFERRRTLLPTIDPVCFTSDFSRDQNKQAQWAAFLKRAGVDAGGVSLFEVLPVLQRFLMPPTTAAAKREAFDTQWPAGGPWR